MMPEPAQAVEMLFLLCKQWKGRCCWQPQLATSRCYIIYVYIYIHIHLYVYIFIHIYIHIYYMCVCMHIIDIYI